MHCCALEKVTLRLFYFPLKLTSLLKVVAQPELQTEPKRDALRQARSQDLEKGGLFWKSEKSANNLDWNFHCSWISFTRFVRKLRRNLSESSESFFRPKSGGIQKKKKKKERSSPKLGLIFRPNPEIQTFEGGCFPMGGGYFQFFTKYRPQKHQKCATCILYKPMGGLEPPPPPLATLMLCVDAVGQEQIVWFVRTNVIFWHLKVYNLKRSKVLAYFSDDCVALAES